MRKILTSIFIVAVMAGVTFAATSAFFNDTETSTENVLQAGSLDLKVDSEAHYNGLVCRLPVPADNLQVQGYHWLAPVGQVPTEAQLALEIYSDPCSGTWSETDLGLAHQFFKLTDVKPGDWGENTISLHVYDNDAWGRFVVNKVVNADNDCTEPELDAEESFYNPNPVTCGDPGLGEGELGDNITFYAWLDQGATPGFQNIQPDDEEYTDTNEDQTEGDNIWQCDAAIGEEEDSPSLEEYETLSPQEIAQNCDEPLVILPGGVSEVVAEETHNIWEALALVDDLYCPSPAFPANGHNNYDNCHGIADDGRMVGSTTYYFGLAWFVGDDVGNVIQTDSLTADLLFEIEQHRNNLSPFGS